MYLDSQYATKLKDVPVYIVCGTQDGLISENSKAYNLLRLAGNANIKMSTFFGGHDPLLTNWQNMYKWIRQWTNQNSTGIVSTEQALNMYLLNNYPNPFNPTTRISFSIAQKGQLKLEVYDVLGRLVSILAEGIYEPGKYEVAFNASNLPSEVYFYSLTFGGKSIVKKMLLIK